jgi:hypothetical protein
MRTPHMILLLGAACCGPPAMRPAATPDREAAWQQARDTAAANYKNARARCDPLTGNPKDLCVAEAKAVRVRSEEERARRYEEHLEGLHPGAHAHRGRELRPRQGALRRLHRQRQGCLQAQAKAMLVAAQADAKADSKTIEARNEAREDKLEAAWKVALENAATPLPAPPRTSAWRRQGRVWQVKFHADSPHPATRRSST